MRLLEFGQLRENISTIKHSIRRHDLENGSDQQARLMSHNVVLRFVVPIFMHALSGTKIEILFGECTISGFLWLNVENLWCVTF